MDEDLAAINSESRNEKIKSFFINNKKLIIAIISLIIISILGFYSYQIFKDGQRERLSNKYNFTVIEYKSGKSSKVIKSMKQIVEDKDSTYSPLALYFLIDKITEGETPPAPITKAFLFGLLSISLR